MGMGSSGPWTQTWAETWEDVWVGTDRGGGKSTITSIGNNYPEHAGPKAHPPFKNGQSGT